MEVKVPDSSARFRLVEPHVAAKVLDGEAILINLANGMYYSLADSGAAVWSLLQGGFSLEETIDRVAHEYDAERSIVEADVGRLAAELLEEGVLERCNGDQPRVPFHRVEVPKGGVYRTPELKRYDDMAEMFALDPPLPELPEMDPRDPGK